MAEPSLLHNLCKSYGILPDYEDVFGNRHDVPVASLLEILSAMGVCVNSQDDMRDALKLRVAACKERMLPPVLVHRQSLGDCLVPIQLDGSGTLSWTLALEDGRQIKGACHDDQQELVLPGPIKLGYHRLTVEGTDRKNAEMALICAPDRCYVPPSLSRTWGLSIQLYAVRSKRNWGMGDFTDLRHMIDLSAKAGAGVVGVNPLHALYPDIPEQASPYCPSSRSFLNTLYIDVEAVSEFSTCTEARERVGSAEFQAQLRALRSAEFVDYPGVHAVKRLILEILHRHFQNHHLASNSERALAFRRFQMERGDSLERQGLYDALQEHFHRQNPMLWGWPVWPAAFHSPHAAEVIAFTKAHADRIAFFQYLQWLADEQLASAGQRAKEHGLGLGLYQDIAVGTDIGGCEVWFNQPLYATGIKVGCPPDEFNRKGQDWGLPPWNPHRLEEAAYAPFIAMLRENMRHAGAIRLDHVMGLKRLFWIPAKGMPGEGGYVLYPLEDLLGILALESQRNECLVVGEDLGTVPKSLQEDLKSRHIFSYRVLMLERAEDGTYLEPKDYPEQALAAISTHDLPTLSGFWKGRDLEVRTELDLFPDQKTRDALIAARPQDKDYLLQALAKQNMLPEGHVTDSRSVPAMSGKLVNALYRHLSSSPCKILLVQPEDVFGQTDQDNMPGTVNEHPNWRRKLSVDMEDWGGHAHAALLFAALSQERADKRMTNSSFHQDRMTGEK